MDKSVRVSEGVWRRLKELSLESGEPVREVVEGLVLGAKAVVASKKNRRVTSAQPSRELTKALETIHGLPEAVGVTEPLTSRPGAYMGIARPGCGRCGHSEVMHRLKGEPVRCQHPACYPNGCVGFKS